jgi:hypothetical protein
MTSSLKTLIVTIQHLKSLKNSFRDYYFLPHGTSNKWIRDLFNVDVQDLTASAENNLVELSCDTSLRSVSIQYN